MPSLPTDLSSQQEAARTDFLALVADVRPDLHRYCARMVGSALDGEDLVQETLATAYFKIALLRDGVPLRAWLFRIAHNKCIDHLRRSTPVSTPLEAWQPAPVQPTDPVELAHGVKAALHRLLLDLAPMERACVVLKDILDHSLEEVAEIVDSTVGTVKSALHRGRAKLQKRSMKPDLPPIARTPRLELLQSYVDRFNAQDWDGLRALLSADARLEVVDRYVGHRREALTERYFRQYAAFDAVLRLSVGYVDGEAVLLCWEQRGTAWQPRSAIRVTSEGQQIKQMRDYLHVEYLLHDAQVVGAPG